MSLILSGTDGLSDVDGTAATPAIRGTDANTGIFFPAADTIAFSEGGVEAARFNADSQFVAAAGTAALPVITTTGDVNTGIFFPAADTIAFSEGGAEAMRIDSSGNVGIGTSSPGARLQVTNTDGEMARFRTSSGSNQPVITISASDSAATVGFATGGNASFPAMTFANGGSERMRIDSSGNVGIGTTSLAILDQAGAGRPLVVKRSDSSTAINSSTASIAIVNGDTTTSNTAQLNFAAITGANTSGYSSAVISCIFGARTNGQYPTGILTFSTSTLLNAAPTEKMRIDSSGNLLFNSGYGSVATAYGCRAWVNFNGTGTVAIRGSGNVSSITDNGSGAYTVNFSTAMPDANYCTNATGTHDGGAYVSWGTVANDTPPTTSAVRTDFLNNAGSTTDVSFAQVSIIR
jgi:hypothetical protein